MGVATVAKTNYNIVYITIKERRKMGLFDSDDEYWDAEMAEEANVLNRAREMGIEETPELRRYIAERDSFSIRDSDLEQFRDDEEEFD